MHNALVNPLEQLAIFCNINRSGPLVCDPEYEFLKQTQVHCLLSVTVVVPLLQHHIFHFCVAVERRKHTVHSGQKLDVLLTRDCVFVLRTGLADECPVFGANRFKFRLRKQKALFGFRDHRLHNMV